MSWEAWGDPPEGPDGRCPKCHAHEDDIEQVEFAGLYSWTCECGWVGEELEFIHDDELYSDHQDDVF